MFCSDFISTKSQAPQSWSPKKAIWSGSSSVNDKKRKAEAASLSSTEESVKKKLDSKSTNTTEGSVKDCDAEDERSCDTTGPDTRPSSSADISRPEISCSPIIAQVTDHDHENVRVARNSTSTPVEKNKKSSVMSSPQKMLKKKLIKNVNNEVSSDEEDAKLVEKSHSKPKSNTKQNNVTEDSHFKEPSLLTDNIVISFSVADMKSLDHAEVKTALDTLKNHGIVRLETSAGKKRLSDGSNISCGGSSGYLGGSSSGVTSSSGSSSQRSR